MSELMEQPVETLDSDAAGSAAAEDNGAASQHDDNNLDADSHEQAEEEHEDIEVGDKKYALPKSAAAILKSERMMNADYTQKTQSVAEERKAVQAERAAVAEERTRQQEYVNEMAKVVAIDERLAQYNALDWDAIIASDPQQAMQLQHQQKTLEQQRQAAQGSLTQKQQQIALNEQQSFAKRVQDAEAYIEREIKGVDASRIKAIETYATSQGMDIRDYAKAIIHTPQVAVMAHKAELYDKLIAKQAPKPAPVAAATPAIRVGSTASVQKDPAKMTDKEFASWRASQIRNRK